MRLEEIQRQLDLRGLDIDAQSVKKNLEDLDRSGLGIGLNEYLNALVQFMPRPDMGKFTEIADKLKKVSNEEDS